MRHQQPPTVYREALCGVIRGGAALAQHTEAILEVAGSAHSILQQQLDAAGRSKFGCQRSWRDAHKSQGRANARPRPMPVS
ncbi:hypothetical protein VPH35_080474 [Triticum aestivum]